MMGPKPQCITCRHFVGEVWNWHCAAFPVAIPDEITTGGFDHTKEYPGDNGIRYEKGTPVEVPQ